MIGQRNAGSHTIDMHHEKTLQAALALLNQQQRPRFSRWTCEVCGMIHTEHMPRTCDSCGSGLFTQHSDMHTEINNHW